MKILKLIFALGLASTLVSSYATENNFSQEERKLIEDLKNKEISNKEEEAINNFKESVNDDWSPLKYYTSDLKAWILNNKSQEIKQTESFLNNPSLIPLRTLQATIEHHNSARVIMPFPGTSHKNIACALKAKYVDPETNQRIEYKGTPFILTKYIPQDQSLSAYTAYLQLPEGIREGLVALGIVKLQEPAFKEIKTFPREEIVKAALIPDEELLYDYLTGVYKKIPADNLTVNISDIFKWKNKLDAFANGNSEQEKDLETLFNDLTTTSMHFLLLSRIMKYHTDNNKPYQLTHDGIIGIFNRFPVNIQKLFIEKGLVQINKK